MPALASRPVGLGCKVILGAMLIGAICLVVIYPAILVLVGIFAILGCLATVEDNRRVRRLAVERACESICTFARSFDYRNIDTWIIRAVFEEIGESRFPIRAEDRLTADLRIDPDDLEDLVEAIAERTGRPLENVEDNPLFGKVATVRRVVEFFTHQPRRI
jgi:hypothetical protein